MRVYDLAQLGRSPLELGDLILQEAVQAPDAQTAFSFVELIIEGTDVPKIVAVIEYPDAGEMWIFFFWCHDNLYNLKNEAN